MLTNSILSVVALPFSFTSAFPHVLYNYTPPINSTTCNSTFYPSNTTSAPAIIPSPTTIIGTQKPCSTAYPSDLTILNARYPNYTITHLQQTNQYIMLRRELSGTGEIATRIQFHNLPSNTSNQTCRLDFMLPDTRLQVIQGTNPTFDVYCVEHETTASLATWLSYEGGGGGGGGNANASGNGNGSAPTNVFGTVNGEAEALEKTRSAGGGVAAVGEKMCNATMAFDVGMRFDSLGNPNYWAFENVQPPASPMQGFRVVFGC